MTEVELLLKYIELINAHGVKCYDFMCRKLENDYSDLPLWFCLDVCKSKPDNTAHIDVERSVTVMSVEI